MKRQILDRLMDATTIGPGVALVQGNALDIMKRLPPKSIDLIFADPPYFLSGGGTTVKSGKRASVDKGEWDRAVDVKAGYAFHRDWLYLARHLLKPTGSIWVSGTQHAIFQVGFTMQHQGYHLLNTVTWAKPNAAPNLGCRMLTHSTELVVWAAPQLFKPLRHTFNYEALKAGNGDRQLRDFWEIATTPDSEKTHGAHPTQKPLELLRRIMLASAPAGGLVLDPFVGSGTTGIAAAEAGCDFIGIDLSEEYLDLAARRIAVGVRA